MRNQQTADRRSRPGFRSADSYGTGLALAVVAALACAFPASAEFYGYASRTGWRQAVDLFIGGPTVIRDPDDYFDGIGQPVNPGIWSDVGVTLSTSGQLSTGLSGAAGYTIVSPPGAAFEVVFDAPITALWFNLGTPSGSITFRNGADVLGSIGDGTYGIISSEPFDRVLLSLGGGYATLYELEFIPPIPGPGGVLAMMMGATCAMRRPRRR